MQTKEPNMLPKSLGVSESIDLSQVAKSVLGVAERPSVKVELIASALMHAQHPNEDTLRDLKEAAFSYRKEMGLKI